MTKTQWTTLVIEQVSNELDCDYSDAEAVYLAKEAELDAMRVDGASVRTAAKYLTA